MVQRESLEEFYHVIEKAKGEKAGLIGSAPGHINVFSRDKCRLVTQYRRRDFYKVTLILGEGSVQYATKNIQVHRPALLFSNPKVPYAWKASSDDQRGWFAVFSESFVRPWVESNILLESPLFKIDCDHIYFLDDRQVQVISTIFQTMATELKSDYKFKYDVVRNYIQLIMHEAMKLNPANNMEESHSSSERITFAFFDILERQFPVEFPNAPLQLKSAKDFASYLSIHVNHLNKVIKKQTLKTTTEHIADRVMVEATSLLKHSDLSISQIGYSLGFDTPAYFTNFFKKQMGLTPMQVRNGKA